MSSKASEQTAYQQALSVGPIHLNISVPKSFQEVLTTQFHAWFTQSKPLVAEQFRYFIDIEVSFDIHWVGKRIQLCRRDKTLSHWIAKLDPTIQNSDSEVGSTIDKLIRRAVHGAGTFYQGGVVHAAGLNLNQRGWLVPGESGRGKSTIFKKAGDLNAGHLHDDLILIFEGHLYSLPSQSSHIERPNTQPRCLPWCGIILLARPSHPCSVNSVRLDAHNLLRIFSAFGWEDEDDAIIHADWFNKVHRTLVDKTLIEVSYEAEQTSTQELMQSLLTKC